MKIIKILTSVQVVSGIRRGFINHKYCEIFGWLNMFQNFCITVLPLVSAHTTSKWCQYVQNGLRKVQVNSIFKRSTRRYIAGVVLWIILRQTQLLLSREQIVSKF